MKFLYMVPLLIAIGLAGCNHETDEDGYSEIYIDHYKSECFGLVLSLCVRSRTNSDSEWELFYSSIEGFDYEWGYNYKLRVLIEDVENPPEDSPSKKYTLVEILSKEVEPGASTFELTTSRTSGLVVNISSGIYEIYGDKEFSCVSQDCATIESLITQHMAILFEFTHASDPTEALVLSQIKCSDTRESFRGSCL